VEIFLVMNQLSRRVKLNEETTIGQEDVGEVPAEPQPPDPPGTPVPPEDPDTELPSNPEMEPGELPEEPGDLPEEPPAGVPPPDTSPPEESGDEEVQPTEPGEE
jgi:hypothetical protein